MGFLHRLVAIAVSRGPGRKSSLLLVLVLTACVTIPIQEMSDARQAIASAADAGAERTVPGAYASAEQLMAMAETDLAADNYTHAREAAGQAKRFAQRARRLATAFERVADELEQADAMGVSPAIANELLKRARAAARSSDESTAALLLRQASDSLHEVMLQSYAEQAQLLIAESSVLARGMSLPQQASLEAARTTLAGGDVERAYNIADSLAAEMRAQGENGGR